MLLVYLRCSTLSLSRLSKSLVDVVNMEADWIKKTRLEALLFWVFTLLEETFIEDSYCIGNKKASLKNAVDWKPHFNIY